MKTLVFLPNWLGDVLFATPTIRAIKESDPDGFLAVVCPADIKQVFTLNPAIDEIITLSGNWSLVRRLRQYRFDRAILLRPSVTRSLIARLAGIPEVIGEERKNKDLFLTKKLPAPDSFKVHRKDYYLEVARGMGIPVNDSGEPDFFISPDDERKAGGLLSSEGVSAGDKYIVINPGANWERKRWEIKSFSRLSDQLIEHTGRKIVVTGSGKDVRLACQMIAEMKHPPVVLTGKTNLKMLGAILKKAELVIANDSGPLHLARALGAKTIALYGPTSPAITGPLGSTPGVEMVKEVGCRRPCYQEQCADRKCMEEITVGEVFEVAKTVIARSR